MVSQQDIQKGNGIAATSSEPRWRISVLELFLLFGLFAFSCDVIDKLLRPYGIDNAAYFGIYLLSAIFLAFSGYASRMLVRAPLLVVLVVLPLASFIWSVDSRMTIVRSTELLGSSIFALLLGWHLRTDALIRKAALAFTFMVAGSFAVIFLVPSLGIAQDLAWGGTWVGLSQHKNGLGGTASLAVLALSYAWLIGGKQRLWIGMAWLAAVALLIGSKSATSQIVTIISLVLGLFVWLYQTQPKLGLLLAVLTVCALPATAWAFVAFDVPGLFVSMIGKDTTLGSRMGIWDLVWPYIEDRWWLGFGYGAFWQPDLPWVDLIAARLNFTPYYSHNGVIELWLGGGLVMVSLTGLVYASAVMKSFVPMLREREVWHHAFAIVFMVTFVLRNLTEAAAMTRNDIAWVLFVAIAAGLARDVHIKWRANRA